MIRFEQVVKTLGGKTVLDGLSFEVRTGEIFVIVGPSGVGKSVTLKHVVRLLTPDAGHVFVDGEDVSRADGATLEQVRRRFGYLFQGGALLAWLNVFENIALPLRERLKLEEREIIGRVDESLRVVGLEGEGSKIPAELSGGMRKRAGLARAIVMKPEIILYDEPTSGLDPVSARTIDALIARTNRELGVTSVVVTHDLHSALTIGTRIALLHDGRFVELSEPDRFIESSHPNVMGFLESQFITKRGSWERKKQ